MGGFGPLSRLPAAVQAMAMRVIGCFVGYGVHRRFHGRRLWTFHAIHHASETLDWLWSVRAHPLNELVSRMAMTWNHQEHEQAYDSRVAFEADVWLRATPRVGPKRQMRYTRQKKDLTREPGPISARGTSEHQKSRAIFTSAVPQRYGARRHPTN